MNPTETSSTQNPAVPPPATEGDTVDNSLGNMARGAATKTRRAAGKAADQTREKVSQVAEDRKTAAADKISGYSDRLRHAAHTAEEEEDPNIAHFTNQAADRLEAAANYVREADFSRLREDAAGVAHRHPALFMGSMLAAGLVLGNLAKASVQGLRDERDGDEQDDTIFEATENDLAANDGTRSGGGATDAIAESFDAPPNRPEAQS